MLNYSQRPAETLDELDFNVRKLVPQLERRLLPSVSVGTSQTAVAHGCPSTPRIFFVTPQSNATVWRSAASDTRCIYVTASTACLADIEVVL